VPQRKLRAIKIRVPSVYPSGADGCYRVHSGQTWTLARASYDANDPATTIDEQNCCTADRAYAGPQMSKLHRLVMAIYTTPP